MIYFIQDPEGGIHDVWGPFEEAEAIACVNLLTDNGSAWSDFPAWMARPGQDTDDISVDYDPGDIVIYGWRTMDEVWAYWAQVAVASRDRRYRMPSLPVYINHDCPGGCNFPHAAPESTNYSFTCPASDGSWSFCVLCDRWVEDSWNDGVTFDRPDAEIVGWVCDPSSHDDRFNYCESCGHTLDPVYPSSDGDYGDECDFCVNCRPGIDAPPPVVVARTNSTVTDITPTRRNCVQCNIMAVGVGTTSGKSLCAQPHGEPYLPFAALLEKVTANSAMLNAMCNGE